MVDMAGTIARSEAELVRRARVEANLSRFLPATVAARIAEGGQSLALGGERRVVSVVFADVTAFTPFVESAPPERVVAFLNELFGVMTEVVFRHEGTVDKFIGDAVMAVFGAPTAQHDHAARAVACAEDLHRFVESSAERWKARYGIEPRLAVGIGAGEALVGNLGSEARMEYTCVGDTVNVAARLEALARPGQTLVTDAVARAAEAGGFEFAALGPQTLRGKAQPIELFELVR
jgi:class 3 adenylate cyclase